MRKVLFTFTLILILGTVAYISVNKFPKSPTRTDSTSSKNSPTPIATTTPDNTKQEIIKGISEKNNWDPSRVELNVTTLEGDYAKGDVRFKDEMGGGLWFAAKVNGAWKIVYDGNGIITCDALIDYPNFPKDLIPQCYDKQTEKMIIR